MKTTAIKRQVSALRVGTVWLILLILLVVLSAVAIAVGSAGYSVTEILRALFSAEKSTVKVIVMNLRLPRLLLAIMIGASLSASGALLQSVMRNPLADPGTIGVSAGAGTAATTILLLFPHMTNAVPLFAFGGAALACCLIYSLAWKGGIDPVRIILSGVAINSVLGAYNSLLQLLYSDSLEGVLVFMNGSLSGRSWSQVQTLAIYAGIGLVLAFLCIKSANTLQLGDEMAKSLGVKVNASRLFLSAVSAFLAAATVSVAGMIGFVGLVVPHIARLLVGSDYKAMLPTSVLLGAVVLLAADTVGRTLFRHGDPRGHRHVGDGHRSSSTCCERRERFVEIRAEKLEISYGDYLAVKDMDVRVEKGKITTIIGPNGSGKSTVLKALTRLLNYRRGAIYLDARSLRDFSAKELARHIGVLPQIHSAPPDFQVKELVSYGRMPYQKWYERCNDEDQKIIDWAMKATGVWSLREKSINECSGGESQRV